MNLTRRIVDPTRKLAGIVWMLPDRTTRLVRLAQDEYEEWWKNYDRPDIYKPHPDAIRLMAMGGYDALEGGDGWPEPGDVWIDTRHSGLQRIAFCVSENTGYSSYKKSEASDPGKGQTSRLTGFRLEVKDQRLYLPGNNLSSLPSLSVESGVDRIISLAEIKIPLESIGLKYTEIDEIIDNHRSVTFGADVEAAPAGFPETYALTGLTPTGSDLHLVAMAASEYGGYPDDTTGIKQGTTNCVMRAQSQASEYGLSISMWDLDAPAGSGDINYNMHATAEIVVSAAYLTGVDGGATPRDATGTASGASTGMSTGATTSSADGMAVTGHVITGVPAVTKDAATTMFTDLNGSGSDLKLSAAYVATTGSSVTVNHTKTGTVAWRCGIITLKAAAAAGDVLMAACLT